MSVESAKAFLQKFQSDEPFRKQLKGAGSKEEAEAVLKEAGFEFTEEECKEASQKDESLSEEDLKDVSGGGTEHQDSAMDQELQAQLSVMFGRRTPPISPIQIDPIPPSQGGE
jgi:predicted ribosomally synthesized peptide with nif11-like leader